jgi:hexosaminidase
MRAQADNLSIVPRPAEIERQASEFVLSSETVISADILNQSNAEYLRDLLAPPTGLPLPIQNDGSLAGNVIRLSLEPDGGLGHEGYTLSVSPASVEIKAQEPSGILYGIQTLRQLLPAQVEKRALVGNVSWRVPCVVIRDAPRFNWRGFMLDEGRHFHGKDTVLRLLDLLALHKLNVFHWHLTEDQGWRIEIARYPRLTEVGSRRKGTTRNFIGRHDGIPHEGFYTQQDIRQIVAHAARRHITIVPEIEMPGHSLAALAAYPELSCTGGSFEVACGFGILRDIYCGGKDKTFEFLQNVLDEVMALFPSPFIHIGGDEVPKSRWRQCPDCQRRIRQERLQDEHALQVYLTNRIAAYLDAHGRRLIGWNQILHQGLLPGAVAQYWVGNRRKLIEAMRGGRDVIVSPFLSAYLDHSYALTSLGKAYTFEPVFAALDSEAAQHVLGLEAPLWTEWVPNRARLDYQMFPRLTAYAETGWTQKDCKNLADFRKRLATFEPRLDEWGVKYAPARDADPPWFRQLFGILTIAQPQTKTAGQNSKQRVEP